MKELSDIVEAWEALCAKGRDALLATVVQVSGSTYRRPGARMLLTPEGRLAGSVSGGCLESDLVKKALWRTEHGAALVTYDSTDEDDIVWGFGLGCRGVVEVLLERVSPQHPGPLDALKTVLYARQPAALATVIDGPFLGQRLVLTASGLQANTLADTLLSAQIKASAESVLRGGKSRTETYPLSEGHTAIVFLEAVLPLLPLIIFGANHDAVPLVRLAKELGWDVTVADIRATSPKPQRFPQADRVLAGSLESVFDSISLDTRTAAVIMTHNFPDDKRVLRRLLESPLSYIGQLGPRTRTERLLIELADDGFCLNDTQRKRLHGPVGLDLGADTPEQIALSIVAEIQAAQTGAAGGFLRERLAPLHTS